ncbi:MAG: paraquat-inducible protein A [Pseudobdellovibrio sp.]
MRVKVPLIAVLLFLLLFLAEQIVSNTIENQATKRDYAELNHVKYGLFSVSEWKNQISQIVADEVSKFNFSTANKKEVKKYVESELRVLIESVDKKIREHNKGSFKGWFKQKMMDSFVDIDDIKKDIPSYADALIKQTEKPKTQKDLKDLLNKRFQQYFDRTFQAQDLSRLNSILVKMKTDDVNKARLQINSVLSDNEIRINREAWLLISAAIILFMILGLFNRQPLTPVQNLVLLTTLIVLLATGISTPMIDMEAKISELSFILMGHPVRFTNQVLYFQSKSILDVFWTMMTFKEVQMKAVGFLVITFSVIFPLLKIISAIQYYYNFSGARDSRRIQFFVFQSGKWSMTDVMVVALFMAYVGFNGIIANQFEKFNSQDPDLVILTTNGTSLQPGFYLFFSYALLALFYTGLLTRPKADVATAVKPPEPPKIPTPTATDSPLWH